MVHRNEIMDACACWCQLGYPVKKCKQNVFWLIPPPFDSQKSQTINLFTKNKLEPIPKPSIWNMNTYTTTGIEGVYRYIIWIWIGGVQNPISIAYHIPIWNYI